MGRLNAGGEFAIVVVLGVLCASMALVGMVQVVRRVGGAADLHPRRGETSLGAHPQQITYVYDQHSQRCKAIVKWCAEQPPEVRPIDCDEALRALGVEAR